MGNCHYCFNCGRCRGETPPGVFVRRCPACRHVNERGARECEACGASLYLDPTKVMGNPRSAAGADAGGAPAKDTPAGADAGPASA
ncbi:hypothetical protein [Adlercreutzia sp. ZJ242]|uniref:hypothetical protein n=1 Tax=Adlercreutzia sp. ZJ242 TaxID=2709409 RepID=UPI0013ED7009|nr:hypothetical protein [Adlercreutzia sp. ZJ242]